MLRHDVLQIHFSTDMPAPNPQQDTAMMRSTARKTIKHPGKDELQSEQLTRCGSACAAAGTLDNMVSDHVAQLAAGAVENSRNSSADIPYAHWLKYADGAVRDSLVHHLCCCMHLQRTRPTQSLHRHCPSMAVMMPSCAELLLCCCSWPCCCPTARPLLRALHMQPTTDPNNSDQLLCRVHSQCL
jgi:hypothetical protein